MSGATTDVYAGTLYELFDERQNELHIAWSTGKVVWNQRTNKRMAEQYNLFVCPRFRALWCVEAGVLMLDRYLRIRQMEDLYNSETQREKFSYEGQSAVGELRGFVYTHLATTGNVGTSEMPLPVRLVPADFEATAVGDFNRGDLHSRVAFWSHSREWCTRTIVEQAKVWYDLCADAMTEALNESKRREALETLTDKEKRQP